MTLQTRMVEANFGDWGHDGHGWSESVRLELTGEDVSDEALTVAKKRANEATGLEIDTFFSDYENSFLEYGFLMKLLKAGMDIGNSEKTDLSQYYFIDDGEVEAAIEAGYKNLVANREFDAVKLVMAFLGFGIKGFSYREVPAPTPIVGGSKAVISNFGYGLFTS